CTTQLPGNPPNSCHLAGLSYALTVTKVGTGTVVPNPGPVNCGGTGSGSYLDGDTVVLTATPGTNYTFSGYSGDCTGTTCSLGMHSAKSVTATFTQSCSPTGSPCGWGCCSPSTCHVNNYCCSGSPSIPCQL